VPFYLRNEGGKKTWFRDIRPAMSLDFDMYHLCLMAGLASRRKADASNEETTELVDHFPGVYRQRGRLLVAAFLARELEAMGVSRTDRASLHGTISRLVDPLSPSRLSNEGMKQFNRYSYGGFDVLTEWFDDRPRAIETFLPVYHSKLTECMR